MAAPKKSVWQPIFLEHFRSSGSVKLACEKAGISRSTAYRARSRSEMFRRSWHEAEGEPADMLVAEAFGRAVRGGEIARDKTGQPIPVTRCSDHLLMFLLRTGQPEKYVVTEHLYPRNRDSDGEVRRGRRKKAPPPQPANFSGSPPPIPRQYRHWPMRSQDWWDALVLSPQSQMYTPVDWQVAIRVADLLSQGSLKALDQMMRLEERLLVYPLSRRKARVSFSAPAGEEKQPSDWWADLSCQSRGGDFFRSLRRASSRRRKSRRIGRRNGHRHGLPVSGPRGPAGKRLAPR